jgi:hypothetical protein
VGGASLLYLSDFDKKLVSELQFFLLSIYWRYWLELTLPFHLDRWFLILVSVSKFSLTLLLIFSCFSFILLSDFEEEGCIFFFSTFFQIFFFFFSEINSALRAWSGRIGRTNLGRGKLLCW